MQSDLRYVSYRWSKHEIAKIGPFKEGYAVTKFKNINSAGGAGADSSGNHVDTDLAIIRLAEVSYAESYVEVGW